MLTFWDDRADAVVRGDNLRKITPIHEDIYEDNEGYTHFVFSKLMFNNPRYHIPEDDLDLFQKFLDGGSRSYPSDGNIPLDVVATEARRVINEIIDITSNPEHRYYVEAKEVLKHGSNTIVRGCVKIYLEKYTSRDWRRKRFTDDIDFWIYKIDLFEYVLKLSGWTWNRELREWEKQVEWIDYNSNEKKTAILTASNDLDLSMDFTNGAYIDGTSLKDIVKKKLKRGHDVDLSDIINIGMLQHIESEKQSKEWREAWQSIEELANTRDSRIVSNMISLCRYAYAIADYIARVSNSIRTHNKLIFDKAQYPNTELKRICRYSPHWMGYLVNNGSEATRSMIYSYLVEQQNFRKAYSDNLKQFATEVLEMLRVKFQHIKIVFEIK
ncbi:MAG: hypothetical protein BAJALOKI1v1_20012 [Promethearchaeota archaeon]|nr:MAG: hypothetical protein BAJALOKI1v1_20012 [Candidatus Lokiarchaeota archaeon]